MAVLLAKAGVSFGFGYTDPRPFTFSILANQPPGSSVYLISAARALLDPGDSISVAALPSDTQSGVWEDSAFAGFQNPVIGAIQGSDATHGNVQLGQTAVRVGGPPLTAGSFATVTWSAPSNPSGLSIVVLMFALTEVDLTAVPQYLGGTTLGDYVNVYYANGDSAFNTTTVNWFSDLGSSFMPYPKFNAKMLSACATYPQKLGWTPTNGIKLDEVHSPDSLISLGVHLADAPALTSIEPGGSWGGSSAFILVSNYQFIEPILETGPINLSQMRYRVFQSA